MSPFILAILVFIVLGFQRGWRRELVSLVFVLLACFLVTPSTSDGLSMFLGQIPRAFALLTNPASAPPPPTSPGFFSGPWWSLAIFAGLIFLGYVVGNKVFPKPATPPEQFIGIIPAVISGAFIFWYLSRYQPTPVIDLSATGPTAYIPVIFVILILALVVALISARVKKAPAKK